MIVVDLFLSRMKIELKTSNILLPYHTSFFSSQIRFLSWNLVIPIPTETEYVEVEGVVQKLSAIWYSSKDLKVFSGSSRKNEKNKTVFVMFSSCGLIGPCDLWQQHFCDTHVLISFEAKYFEHLKANVFSSGVANEGKGDSGRQCAADEENHNADGDQYKRPVFCII